MELLGALQESWAALPVGLRVFYGLVFGALNGWFAGVVIERVPRGIGISGVGDSPRSTCECGHILRWRENIPIVSYLAQRGKARCCGRTIPRWYFGIEVAMAAWWGLAAALPWLFAALVTAVAGFAIVVPIGIARQRRA